MTTVLRIAGVNWKDALNRVRAARGATGPYSVHLVDKGLLVVDPGLGLQYLIAKEEA